MVAANTFWSVLYMKPIVLNKMFQKTYNIPLSENNHAHLCIDVMFLLTETLMANKTY